MAQHPQTIGVALAATLGLGYPITAIGPADVALARHLTARAKVRTTETHLSDFPIIRFRSHGAPWRLLRLHRARLRTSL